MSARTWVSFACAPERWLTRCLRSRLEMAKSPRDISPGREYAPVEGGRRGRAPEESGVGGVCPRLSRVCRVTSSARSEPLHREEAAVLVAREDQAVGIGECVHDGERAGPARALVDHPL